MYSGGGEEMRNGTRVLREVKGEGECRVIQTEPSSLSVI